MWNDLEFYNAFYQYSSRHGSYKLELIEVLKNKDIGGACLDVYKVDTKFNLSTIANTYSICNS